jgi:hypothetical protein
VFEEIESSKLILQTDTHAIVSEQQNWRSDKEND